MGILKLLLVRKLKEITILAKEIFEMCPVAIQRRREIMFSPIIAAIRGNFVHDNSILDGSLFQAAVISKVRRKDETNRCIDLQTFAIFLLDIIARWCMNK